MSTIRSWRGHKVVLEKGLGLVGRLVSRLVDWSGDWSGDWSCVSVCGWVF